MKTHIEKYRTLIVAAIDTLAFFAVYQFPKLSMNLMSLQLSTATKYVHQITTPGEVRMGEFTCIPTQLQSKARI